MTEQSRFESLVAERLAAYAAGADRPFDATEIARGALGARPDRMSLRGLRILGWPVPALLLLALVTMLIAVAIAAVGSGLVRLPWTGDRSFVPPGEIDTCGLLLGAVRGAGQWGPSDRVFPNHKSPGWDARGCAYGWDGGWNDRHLLLRARPTSPQEAARIIDTWASDPAVLEWTAIQRESWEADSGETDRVWSAVAVSYEPYFFVVTGRDRAAARALSISVEYQLLLGHGGFGDLQNSSPGDGAACSLISERFLSERFGPGLFHIVEWRPISTDWAVTESAPTKLGPGSGRCFYFQAEPVSTVPYAEVFLRIVPTTSAEADSLAGSLLGSQAVPDVVAGRPAWRVVEDPEHPSRFAIAVFADPHFVVISAAMSGEPGETEAAGILRALADEALANLED